MAWKNTEKARIYKLEYNRKWREQNRERFRAAARNRYQRNRDKVKQYNHKRGQAFKIKAFEGYGGASCVCCGETHVEFLSIDHIGGGGTKHRRDMGGGHKAGAMFCKWLIDQGYPPGYRVLCMNCNCSLGYFGYCPHGNLNDPVQSFLNTNSGVPPQNGFCPLNIGLHTSGPVGRDTNQLCFEGFGNYASDTR